MPFNNKLIVVEKFIKYCLYLSFTMLAYSWLTKDKLPDPDFYFANQLKSPVQKKIDHEPIKITSHSINYLLKPLYSYQLEGVIVSLSNADQIGNIWHHRRWKDFINIRDLCVIWGKNVTSNIYQSLRFTSDSWTCWVSAKNRQTFGLFNLQEFSNNHLLINDDDIKKLLMSSDIGDQIRIKGMLVNYKNIENGISRNTSITRNDKGNGACETIYVTDFEILKRANKTQRDLFSFFKVFTIICLFLYILLLGLTPKISKRNY